MEPDQVEQRHDVRRSKRLQDADVRGAVQDVEAALGGLDRQAQQLEVKRAPAPRRDVIADPLDRLRPGLGEHGLGHAPSDEGGQLRLRLDLEQGRHQLPGVRSGPACSRDEIEQVQADAERARRHPARRLRRRPSETACKISGGIARTASTTAK